MKIAVSAVGAEVSARAEERFGRCAYFVVFNENGELLEVIKNDGVEMPQGAGIKSAQMLIKQQVDIVLTGRVGPKAMQALSAGGVAVYTGVSGSAKESLDLYRDRLLQSLTVSNSESHGRVVT